MKTQSILLRIILTLMIGVAFLILISFIFSGCKNENSGTPGTLILEAGSPKLMLKSGTLVSAGGATLKLDVVTVEIKNLIVEENSGSDNQNQVGDQSGDTTETSVDSGEKASSNAAADSGDLHLTGPFVLDVTNNTASIDQVSVLPGTYKKVDFEFYPGTENNGHSIFISGTFTNSQGVCVPFTLVSNATDAIQLPLSGISVSSGGTTTISIVFDVNNWLNDLDFNTATQANGQIAISSAENTGLYQAFMSVLAQHIDIQ